MAETNVTDFIDELGAGVFKEMLAHQLSKTALATHLHGSKSNMGKITMTLTIRTLSDSQMIVNHKLSHSTPTKSGKTGEEHIAETAFFIGRGGVLTIMPPKEGLFGGQDDLIDSLSPLELAQETDGNVRHFPK